MFAPRVLWGGWGKTGVDADRSQSRQDQMWFVLPASLIPIRHLGQEKKWFGHKPCHQLDVTSCWAPDHAHLALDLFSWAAFTVLYCLSGARPSGKLERRCGALTPHPWLVRGVLGAGEGVWHRVFAGRAATHWGAAECPGAIGAKPLQIPAAKTR